jgi:hypothetical protein
LTIAFATIVTIWLLGFGRSALFFSGDRPNTPLVWR